MKQDLTTLDIKDGANLTSKLLTLKYKKLAKIHHPDRKGVNKEEFQRLKNAFDRLIAMVDNCCYSESDEDYETDFVRTYNFSLEKKDCFVVIMED